MTRPNPYAELTNPDSDLVQEALTRKCVCGAKGGQDCVNTITKGEPLPGRLVHIARTCE